MKNLKKAFLILISVMILSMLSAFSVGAELVSEKIPGDAEGTYITMTYDTETFAMQITHDNTGWQELQPITDSGNQAVQDFFDKYRTEVKTIDIGKFSKIQIYTKHGARLFDGMTALESVHFAQEQDIIHNHQWSYKKMGLFKDCPNLTTVWFGDDINKIDGCANFTGVGSREPGDYFMKDLFLNCTSLKSVIFPEQEYYTSIDATTFGGCTGLVSVTLPKNFVTIPANAFKDCISLEAIKAGIGTAAFEYSVANGYFKYLIDTKPDTSKAHASGHLIQMANKVASSSNIKWELHNEGTKASPEYTLYLYIDETVDSTNTSITAGCREWTGTTPNSSYVGADGYVKNPSWIGSAQYQYQAYYCADVPKESIKKAVIGDGITAFANAGGIFLGLTGLETVELPASLVQMQYPVFTGCSSLSTVYVRENDNTPIKGTVDFGKISATRIKWCWYYFGGCSSVEQYIFYEGFNSSGEIAGGTFQNNTSLKSINLNSRNVGTIGKNAFLNCTSLTKVTLDDSATAISATAFNGCTNLSEIVFTGNTMTIAVDSTATDQAGVTADNASNAFQNCSSLTKLSAPIGSDAHAFALKYGFDTTHEIITTNNDALLVFDPENGTVNITKVGTEYAFYYDDANAQKFFDAYRTDITSVKVGKGFGKLSGSSTIGMFEGMTSLVSVNFPRNQRFSDYYKENGTVVGYGSLFKGCSSLTTVWFGDDENKKEGVVDFSGMYSNCDDTPGAFTISLFEGCSSIKEVILPALENTQNSTGSITNDPAIHKSTFSGCTSLVSITVPETFDGIENGAFESCTSLKTINYYAPTSLIGKDTFEGTHSGLVVKCQSYDDANTINALLTEKGISPSSVTAFYKNGMTILGYQVRTSGYNGLRTTFIFNETAYPSYSLVECGTLTAQKANWEKYSESLGEANSILTHSGSEFITPAKNIVKTPIYKDGKYINNYKKVPGGVEFTVTVTKFEGEAQFKSEIVSCGYEIWKKADGSYYACFTRETTKGYETNSLYKTTLGMLGSCAILLEGGDNPVYNTLMECGHTTFTPHEAVKGYLFADPIDTSKCVAVYMTDSATPIELENSGFEGSEIADISYMVFGKNVSFPIPTIDDYWMEHLHSQIAALPKGRSFIAITDTHYQSGGKGNVGKSADLMQYVRKMTGIEKVINLGDPFHEESTYEGALDQLSRSMETKFFDYFGEDGLYAIGNHDSNLTMARTAGDSDNATYKMDILLSDKDIYDTTFAHVEEGGLKNKNIVYDEALLSIIEANKNDIKAFVLDNVAAADAKAYNNMFGNVSYTAEEMYENLVSWAKMHYAYYDHENKMCYIVLNTGGLTVSDFATLNRELWVFHPSQYEFIATILTQISESYSDYDVIVAGHMLYNRTEADTNYQKALYSMLSAFEGGTAVSFSASGNNAFSGKLFGCENNATSRTLSYDFSDRSFTGEIVCLTGHCHIDLELVSQTKDGTYYMSTAYDEIADNISDNAVLLLLLNQDNADEKNQSAENGTQEPIKGTLTEQCFTIFTITDDNTLVATRIGANSGQMQKTYKLG